MSVYYSQPIFPNNQLASHPKYLQSTYQANYSTNPTNTRKKIIISLSIVSIFLVIVGVVVGLTPVYQKALLERAGGGLKLNTGSIETINSAPNETNATSLLLSASASDISSETPIKESKKKLEKSGSDKKEKSKNLRKSLSKEKEKKDDNDKREKKLKSEAKLKSSKEKKNEKKQNTQEESQLPKLI